MNVFEELIEELKDENLLEETIIDVKQNIAAAGMSSFSRQVNAQTASVRPFVDISIESAGPEPQEDDDSISGFAPAAGLTDVDDESEFYRKRAIDEVASLQMVEHLVSAIERDHMKMAPATYNEIKVKTALHNFLKVANDPQSPEHLEAEGLLIHETDLWCSALAARDQNISVANVRKFCENSRPVLSSQAMIALARFYRISPFSEPVRSKFDFVMTRLFSRDGGNENRGLLFRPLEMVGHIRDLYDNWASLSLFNAVTGDSEVAETLVAFRQFVGEAESADSFDELIAADFFNRLRLFKEETCEMFYIPEITGAAIECNVSIGNRFVELLDSAKSMASVAFLEDKYGYGYDTIISSAASKTMLLGELINRMPAVEAPEEIIDEPVNIPEERRAVPKFERPNFDSGRSFRLAGINPWLIAATILVLVVSVGIYMWSGNSDGEAAAVAATELNLDGSGLKEAVRVARGSGGSFYGIVQPSWDNLNADEQKQLLKKAVAFGATKGLNHVYLLSSKGRTVGYGAGDRLEVFKQ
ncbi:MAG TPA: hypothetical protein VK468_06860 [Pyrinomonadaceae bacterium]|nr:hypothetical protein [Pyrinomonadaceae bacterium]